MADALPQPTDCCETCGAPISVAVPGPAGTAGAAGGPGTNGENAFTALTASFVMPPSANATTTFRQRTANVATLTAAAAHNLTTGQYVDIAGVGGVGYNLTQIQVTVTGATTFTYASVAADEVLTADVGGTISNAQVVISVGDSDWASIAQIVYIQNAGYMTLRSKPSGTQMRVSNPGYTGNAAAATTIANLSTVSPGGLKGVDGVAVPGTLNALSPTTTKGDLLADNGAASPAASLVRFAAGANGRILATDSAQAAGLSWQPAIPTAATDNAIARFDGASGLPVPLQNSSMAVTDSGDLQITTGNAKGANAVDLQSQRVAATQVASGDRAVVAGGNSNTASGTESAVGGGVSNMASGLTSSVGGGAANTASAQDSTVGGGSGNTASGLRSAVGGGGSSTASGENSTIGGGFANTASALSSTVAGGSGHTASGQASSILGGASNQATAQNSAVTGGTQALANKYGQIAHAAGIALATGDRQTSVMVLRRNTTDAAATQLFLDGASLQMVLANDTLWAFRVLIAARRLDVDNGRAGYEITGVIWRDAGAATTTVGGVVVTILFESDAAWDAAAVADAATGALRINVTGEVGKTIGWVARVELAEVTG